MKDYYKYTIQYADKAAIHADNGDLVKKCFYSVLEAAREDITDKPLEIYVHSNCGYWVKVSPDITTITKDCEQPRLFNERNEYQMNEYIDRIFGCFGGD